MEVSYATSAFDRERGSLPFLPVINMFVEASPTETQPVLQSRPGLQNSAITMGSGPIKALYRVDGVLSNALFGISGTSLYSSGTLIGAVDGSGPFSIAGFEDRIFISGGARLWGYNGTALAAIAFPDSANTLKVVTGASRAIVIRKDTGKFYWSDVLSNTVNALSFATAENSPDKLKDMLYLGDRLILFGTETVEFWPATTDSDSPFQPLVGLVFQAGIRDTGCATKIGNTFAWVTDSNQVCLTNPETVISNPGLDAKIAASTAVSLWAFEIDGSEFLALRLDTETWVWHQASRSWTIFESFGETNWLPQCYEAGYFGSSENGRLYTWTSDHADFGSLLERRMRLWAPITSGSVFVFNLTLRVDTGRTPYLTGDYDTPSIELRLSRDGGVSFNEWKIKSLGARGRHRTKVRFLSLGSYGYPGVMGEIRVTDPVPFRMSGAVVNEPLGSI